MAKGTPATEGTPAMPGRSTAQVLVVGGMHAREWASIVGVMYAAEQLLLRHDASVTGTNASIRLLDHVEVVVVPVANPDGYVFSFGPPGSEDGVCANADYAAGVCNRLWRKTRAPHRVMPQCVGVDLNRNWPLDWGFRGVGGSIESSYCSELWHGEAPLSAPESQAVREPVRVRE